MTTETAINPVTPFAPSELVLLRGDQFATKALLGNVQLLLSEESVSIAKLGEAILGAAFLACHEVGSIRLEKRQKKAMLGLRKVDRLYATPADLTVPWPTASLEAAIGELARRNVANDEHEVRNLIYRWLAEDHANPWQETIDRIKAGLAERGLLNRFDEKRLKIFVVTRYEAPPATNELAMHQPLEPVLGMLRRCQDEQAEIWKLLLSEIKAAIKSRTEDTDTDSDFD